YQRTPPTEAYTLSLHDALPISGRADQVDRRQFLTWQALLQTCNSLFLIRAIERHHGREDRDDRDAKDGAPDAGDARTGEHGEERSEEHTSELQSRGHLVCRLLL